MNYNIKNKILKYFINKLFFPTITATFKSNMLSEDSILLINDIYLISIQILEIDKLIINNIMYNNTVPISIKIIHKQQSIFYLLHKIVSNLNIIIKELGLLIKYHKQVLLRLDIFNLILNNYNTCIDVHNNLVALIQIYKCLSLSLTDNYLYIYNTNVTNDIKLTKYYQKMNCYYSDYLNGSIQLQNTILLIGIIKHTLLQKS